VPAISAAFWVVTVLSTTIGETFSDLLSINARLGPAVTDAAMTAVLVGALVIQLRTREYTPWIYWLAITSIDTPRREGFYWGAILTTFALGTAAGDLATEALGPAFRPL
jgi:uncharacterized membrane-anchored protein